MRRMVWVHLGARGRRQRTAATGRERSCRPAAAASQAAPAVHASCNPHPPIHTRMHPTLHRAEFVFINPNAKGTCGCGESFTVDPKAAKQNAAAVQQQDDGSGEASSGAAGAGGQG